MDWALNLAERTTPDSLKSKLEALRDEWIKTTPQESHDYNIHDNAIAKSINDARADAVKIKADLVKERSSQLDEVHKTCVDQMNRAIEAVSVLVGDTTPVRVTLSGHFRPDEEHGRDHRVTVSFDQAL